MTPSEARAVSEPVPQVIEKKYTSALCSVTVAEPALPKLPDQPSPDRPPPGTHGDMFELHVSVTGRPVTCAFVSAVSVTCGASATTSTSALALTVSEPLPHTTMYVTVPAFCSTRCTLPKCSLDGPGQKAPGLPPDNVHGTTFVK